MNTILATVPALLAPMGALAAQSPGSPEHSHHWDWGWGWGGMILGPLMMIFWVAVLVVVVVLVVRWLGGSAGGAAATRSPPTKMPVEILKERFARGEIDKEEFEERRRTLEN